MFEVVFYMWHYFENVCFSLLTLLYLFICLKCHGDIELNPHPRKFKNSSLSVCHWNLNNLTILIISKVGVCIYHKESLPVQEIKLSYFKEALLLEMDYNNKKVLISAIYCSPNQNKNEFDLFLASLEQLLGEINKRKP